MNFRRSAGLSAHQVGKRLIKAPAGPGVWVLTDSDLSDVLLCRSLSNPAGSHSQLMRSSAARRGESIRPQLADHLGIPNRGLPNTSPTTVWRWLQMDDDAAHFAHFSSPC